VGQRSRQHKINPLPCKEITVIFYVLWLYTGYNPTQNIYPSAQCTLYQYMYCNMSTVHLLQCHVTSKIYAEHIIKYYWEARKWEDDPRLCISISIIVIITWEPNAHYHMDKGPDLGYIFFRCFPETSFLVIMYTDCTHPHWISAGLLAIPTEVLVFLSASHG
jgi:hypothetical protein